MPLTQYANDRLAECNLKQYTLYYKRKFLPSGGGGEKKLFLIIVNVLGHPKGVGGLTSYFLCGGSMDVFWNDPIT
jgi:hypothetical protein